MSRRDFWSEYSNIEEKYANKIKELAESIKNPVIKAVLTGVSEDSVKHSYLYKTLYEMEAGYTKLIDEADYNIIAGEIDQHIKTEEKMIKDVEELLKDIDDKAMKFILEYILKDERIHHAMLLRVKEMIVKRHTLSESELWELIWKDALYHGTPGG